jgi:squalene monooxygenase
MSPAHYDIIVVGAGIAGSALAHALATITSPARQKPLRIALLERSLAEPDRIVGELLQPGGVMALKKLGMASCLDGIDAVPVHGYCIFKAGESIRIPYPPGHVGRSFHHGRFIMRLREKARQAPGVDVIEANVTDLIECELTKRVIGIRAVMKDATAPGSERKQSFMGDLVIIADGCFSNFRNAVLGGVSRKPITRSHFVGAVLEDARLPIDKHGTVALVKGYGPVLLYQISEHTTRMLVDVKQPLPADLKVCLALYGDYLIDGIFSCSHTSSLILSRNYPRLYTFPFDKPLKKIDCGACPTHSFRPRSKAGTKRKRE